MAATSETMVNTAETTEAPIAEAPATEAPAAEAAPEEPKQKWVLFMGNLPFAVSKDKVSSFFKDGGAEIVNVRIPMDKMKQEPKGFAFVEFPSEDAMLTGLKLNNTDLGGRQIKVERTAEKPNEGPHTKQEWTENTIVELRFALPTPYVRKVIGKKGDCIKRVSKESGAKAMFGEILPESWTIGPDLQHLSIKGNLNEIQAAVVLIAHEMLEFEEEKGRVDKRSRAPEGHISLTMLVPIDKIPMVIGQRGCRIKEIEKESGTVVDVQEDQIYSEKYVTFTGEKEPLGNAIRICAKGLPVETWDPQRPSVTPKMRGGRGEKGGPRGGRRGPPMGRFDGPPRRGPRGYDDYGPGPMSPRFRPPPRDYDDYYDSRGPPPRDYYDSRGPPAKRGRYNNGGSGGGGPSSFGRGPPPPRDFYAGGRDNGPRGGFDDRRDTRAPPADDFWY